ncbi:hypothetical protein HMPREF3231_00224 [Bifidobacterium longum]|nr:hypothetical protein HMPREF3231_00224 [Bifidobacterium longum]
MLAYLIFCDFPANLPPSPADILGDFVALSYQSILNISNQFQSFH